MRNHNAGRVLCAAAAALLITTGAGRAEAAQDDGETVEQIIEILKQKGLIDEQEEERLLMKNASESGGAPSVEAGASILDGFDFYGDFRLRYEMFNYSEDPGGNDPDNRSRFRYRVRMGFEKPITDTLTFGLRLVTGGTPDSSETRSTNQTLGREEDFNMDALWIDRAYIRWKLPEVGGLQSALVAGKTANPFVWKYGKDAVMFDGDITPEGGALLLAYPIDEHSRLFGNFGVYIIDENSSSADPKLTAAQLGGQTEVGGFDMGLRGSMYWYRSLDSDYITASEEFGNLPTAYDGGKSRLGEISAFIGTELHEDWPALAYGSFTKNFDAESGFCTVYEDAAGDLQPIDCSGAAFVPPAGSTVLGASSASDQDEAWSAGVEVGSLKKILKVGFAYFYVEANAVSSIFTDSDILDGYTNREGWVIYGGRQLTTNTEFRFAFYKSTYIENGGAFVLSTDASKRSRLQTDVIFKF